LHVRQR